MKNNFYTQGTTNVFSRWMLFTSCILLSLFSVNTYAVIPVTVTNNALTIPAMAASYLDLNSALTDLNLVTGFTGAGNVTLTLAAGSETAPSAAGFLIQNPNFTAANQIIITAASTSTLNAAVGTNTPASAVQDGILTLVGADYVTIDGLTLADGNATNPATMEYGIGLFKASATDGCNNNTIQKCVITLNRVNNDAGAGLLLGVDGSRGISILNSAPATQTTAVVVTAASGSNSNNKIYLNTVQNCNIGVALIGYVAPSPYTLADQNNDIGGSSSITGNIILNFGGATAAANAAYGINTLAQYGLNVSYNTVNSNDGGGVNHPNALEGINTSTAAGASETVSFNTITVKGGGTTQDIYAIDNDAGSSGVGNTVNIINNTITGCTYPSTTTGGFLGTYSSSSPVTLNINNNTYSLNSLGTVGIATTATPFYIYVDASTPGTLNVNSNQLLNNSTSATSGAGVSTIMIIVSAVPTVARSVNSNVIDGFTFNAANTGQLQGIRVDGTTTVATSTVDNNTFKNITHTSQGVGASHIYILHNSASSNTSNFVRNNTFENLNVNITGSVTCIWRLTGAFTSTGGETVDNNRIVGTFTKGGAGGTVTFIGTPGGDASVAGSRFVWTNNNFSNVTCTGVTAVTGLSQLSGLSVTDAPIKTLSNNTVSNIITGAANITGVQIQRCATTSAVTLNTFSNWTNASTFAGIVWSGTSSNGTNTISFNTFTNLNSTGSAVQVQAIQQTTGNAITSFNINDNSVSGLSALGASTVLGIFTTGVGLSGGLINIFNNAICNLSSDAPTVAGGGSARGILCQSAATVATTFNVYNNRIANLLSPNGAAANAVRGIDIANTTAFSTSNISYNSVYLNASSTGSPFGSSALNASITPSVKLNNNIFVNASSNNGTGLAAAYRRSAVGITTYLSGNRNDFFGSTIFTDGTNTFTNLGPGLGTYKDFVAPLTPVARDVNSISENPPFLSTACGNANFLKINTAIATGVESGGAPVAGITTDFEGNTRNASTPDIGADEFTGIPLPPCAAGFTSGITGSTDVCTGLGTTLTAAPSPLASSYTYQWASAATSGGPYTTLGTALTQPTGALIATTYYILTISCPLGGTPATSTEFTVTVHALPTVTATPSSATYCSPGAGVSISAGGAISYTWSPSFGLNVIAGSSVVASPNQPITYTVTGTDGFGCANTATSLISGGIATPGLTASSLPATICNGATSQLSAAFPGTLTYPSPVNFYSFRASIGATLDPMTGATTLISAPAVNGGAGDDTPVGPQGIGFNFNYNGTDYSTYSVSPDGFLVMGGPAVAQFTNAVQSNTNIPKIYPLWDDLATGNGTTGHVKSLVTGTAPNRILKVEWLVDLLGSVTTPASSTFQAWLYEGTGIIEFRYGSIQVASTSASGGLTGSSSNFQSITFSTKTVSTVAANDNNILSPTSIPNGTMFTFTPPVVQFNYAWVPSASVVTSTASSTATTNLTVTTQYTVTVSNGGCSTSATTSVVVEPLSCNGVSAPGPHCDNASFNATVSTTGGGGVKTYSWSVYSTPSNTLYSGPTVGSAVQPFTLPAGTYSLECTVTDDCSPQGTCTSSVAVTVNSAPAGVAISPTSGLICNPLGTAITLTAVGGTTYSWSPSSGLSAATGATVIANPTASTGYTVTATDGNGCANTATTSISVGNAVTMCSVTNSNPSVACGGTSVLTAVASASVPQTYCAASQNLGSCSANSDEHITNVTFNTINNTSTCAQSLPSGYTDYTSISTPVVGGTTYTITVINGGVFTGDQCKVYIDFNQNGLFTDAGETFTLTSPDYATWTASILIPTGAYNGVTRMRARVTFGTVVPCDPLDWGETEDYTLTISGATCHPSTPGLSYAWTPSTYLSASTGNPVTATPLATTSWTVTATGADGCSATGTASVNAGVPLSCGSLTVNSPTCSGTTFTVSASGVSGGGAPYTYQWKNGTTILSSTTSSVTANLPAGTYAWSARVTDNCGNTCFTTLSVVVDASPSVSVAPTSGQICNPGGTAVTLTASGAVSYSWAPTGETTSSISVLPASSTTYTVTGTAANGCTASATSPVQVGTVPVPTASALKTNVCSGENTTLNVSATIPVSYLYCIPADAANPFVCNAAQPKPYIDQVTFGTINNASACAVPDYSDYTSLSTNLSSGPIYLLSVNLPIIYTSGGNLIIVVTAYFDYNQDGDFDDAGETITLTHPASNFSWEANIVVPPTAYNGSTRMRVRMQFTPPFDDVSPCDDLFFSSEAEDYTIVISGATNPPSPFSYSWAPTAYVNNSSIQSPQTKDLVSGTTTVYTVSTTYQGCSATATVSVSSGDPLTCSSAIVSAGAICEGTNFTVTAQHSGGGSPYTVSWDDGAGGSYTNGESVTANLTAGSYTFTATVLDACGSTCSSTVVVDVKPIPNASISPNSGNCSNDLPILLTGNDDNNISATYTYLWRKNGIDIPASNSSTYNATTTGSYTVVVTSSDGCPDESGPVSVNPSPNAITVTSTNYSVTCGGTSDLSAISPYSGSFLSTTPIDLAPNGFSGFGSPYPATVAVSGVPANAVLASVSLNGLTHAFPADIILMLQSPTGTNVYLMGGHGGSLPVSGVDVVVQDGAGAYTNPLVSGTYAPASIYIVTWQPPGPGQITPIGNVSLSNFTAGTLNGTWNLYSLDADAHTIDDGFITSWSLNFQSPEDPSLTYSWSPVETLNSSLGNSVTATPVITTVYTVTATNTNGCTSTATSTVVQTGSCGLPLYIKVFIEGYYEAANTSPDFYPVSQMRPCLYNNDQAATIPVLPFPQGPYAITDCDYLEISAMSDLDGTFLESQTGLLQVDGTVNVTFTSISPTSLYYIRLIHRNALETWSSVPVDFGLTSPSSPYDFTTAQTQAYSTDYGLFGMHQMTDGPWAILSGDMGTNPYPTGLGIQDGNIDSYDFNYWDADNSTFNYGYLVGDLNGDVNVDSYDYNFWDVNNAAFQYVQRPF